MFNNLFDSFHDTVADAKKEREQLDRLLTISTPRERALVAVTALVLFIFAAWLFFGNVARSVAIDGVLVGPGEISTGADRPLQAAVWLERDVAQQIEAGMPALAEVAMSDGAGHSLAGEVAAITTLSLSDGLAPLESAAPASIHRVSIALDEDLDFASLEGTEFRVVIELGRQSPISLFGLGSY